MNERVIEQYLVRKVKAAGGIAYKFTSHGRRAVPDRIVLLPGSNIIFVECKRPGAKATKAQQYELDRISRLGFRAMVIDSKSKVETLIENYTEEYSNALHSI